MQSHVAAWMGGKFRGGWIHVYICMAESLPCSPKTITMLFIGYTLIQNKNVVVWQKKFF